MRTTFMQSIRKQIGRLGLALLLLAVLGCGEETPPTDSPPAPAGQTAAPRDGVIVAVGDSLTAGYRVAEDQAYPAILQQRLDRDGYNLEVINAGISGETSSGTLARLDWILTLKPAIIILETGANDGLRGIDPQLTRDNIDRIVTRLKTEGIVVVLAGMKMIKNLGKTFTRDFESLYPAIAAKQGVIFIPFFLEGVAANRQLNQADGIHPTEEGYRRVVDHVYPFVVEAIKGIGVGSR
jgi:acyl-CoA thioesterase-1